MRRHPERFALDQVRMVYCDTHAIGDYSLITGWCALLATKRTRRATVSAATTESSTGRALRGPLQAWLGPVLDGVARPRKGGEAPVALKISKAAEWRTAAHEIDVLQQINAVRDAPDQREATAAQHTMFILAALTDDSRRQRALWLRSMLPAWAARGRRQPQGPQLPRLQRPA
eukprot:TRINITY_DN40150_c0_g1_i1.p1 TRINITY_DN40150_c0_g1~~TRINITY_DN40150_c0_g1_i1.p1  ORF type:complete len:173 (+),score=6.17 TRINITY_DN40150_c0_g1_i1:283-801(+)